MMATRRPSIVMVMSHFYPRLGLETATIALAHALGDEYDTKVVCLAQDKVTLEANKALLGAIPAESWGGTARGLHRISSAICHYPRLRSINSDLVILCGAWAAIPYLIAMPRQKGSRVIVWEHSFEKEKIRSNRTLRVLRSLARLVYKRAGVIVCVSERLLLDLERAGFHGRKAVIPNLIDVSVGKLERVHERGRLSCVGTLSSTKNQALAITALALLPDAFTLDIVGDGPERHNLEDLASMLGVDSRVTFHGYLDSPFDLMQRASIFVHPALGETFGIALFEASALGLPVVALNQSIMAEFVPNLIPGELSADTAESFASAIRKLDEVPPTHEEFEAAKSRRELLISDAKSRWHREITLALQR